MGPTRSICSRNATHEWASLRLSTQKCGRDWSGAQLRCDPVTTPDHGTDDDDNDDDDAVIK